MAQASYGNIAEIKPSELNAREHNPRNIGMIERAIEQVGVGRSIVVDENNQVLAGDGTLEAAINAGIENVIFVDTDGDELVAVERVGLTEEQKTLLALYDNRANQLSQFSPVALKQVLELFPQAAEGFWKPKELSNFLGAVFQGTSDASDDPPSVQDSPPSAASVPVSVTPLSQIKVVQLFFSPEQHQTFISSLKSVQQTGMTTQQTVLACLRKLALDLGVLHDHPTVSAE